MAVLNQLIFVLSVLSSIGVPLYLLQADQLIFVLLFQARFDRFGV